MSTMQAFHAQLFQAEVYDPRLQGLSELTRATATQMKALASDHGWNDWDGKAA